MMPGVLLIISGPSGVGKTTICKRLAGRLDALLSVSATTRPRRDNEIDGQDYHFLSREEFDRRLKDGEFLEHAEVYGGNCYGTLAAPVLQALESGRVVILEIEIEGTLQVLRRFPEALGVYVLPPTAGDLRDRLVGRKKDSAEAIRERLSKADGEIRYAQESGAYPCFVINADIDETVDAIARRVQEKKGE
jgi:guanylate kinase